MKKILKNAFKTLLLTLTFCLSSAYANQWNHIDLKSKQGAMISLDYTLLTYSYYGKSVVTHMPELWIHVNRNDLRASDKIRVILINHSFYNPDYVHTQSYDLEFAGDGLFSLKSNNTGMNIFNATQEMAVVINGEWQKTDWNSDISNFILRLVPFIPN